MSDRKKLMNEVLPAPHVMTPGPSVRERVTQKMRVALAAGMATAAVNGCTPFAVVDPLPPPSACADKGPTQAVTVTAAKVAGSNPPSVNVTVGAVKDSGLTFGSQVTLTGGTIVQQIIRPDPSGQFVLQADANATELVLKMPMSCSSVRAGGTTDSILVVTIDMLTSSTPSVTVTDVPAPDGGIDGGGLDGGGLDGGGVDGGDGGITDGGDGG